MLLGAYDKTILCKKIYVYMIKIFGISGVYRLYYAVQLYYVS